MIHENDYSVPEDDLDYQDEIPEWLQEELKMNKQLNSIKMFKHCIRDQPKFVAIDNISGIELLNFIKSNDKSKQDKLEPYEVSLFDDLYEALFGIKGSKEVYEAVTSKIFKKCYVGNKIGITFNGY